MCDLVWERMSPAIVRSNISILPGARYKEVYICQRLDMVDTSAMALLALWRVYGVQRLGILAADRHLGRLVSKEDGNKREQCGEFSV